MLELRSKDYVTMVCGSVFMAVGESNLFGHTGYDDDWRSFKICWDSGHAAVRYCTVLFRLDE